MKKQHLLLFVVSSLLVFITITSCNKLDKLDDLEVVNYDAEFAIPLFSGTASFEDVLQNFDEGTFVTILPDGLVQLNYKGNVVATSSTDIFEGLTVIPFPILDTLIGLDFNVPGNIDVDLAILSQGTIEWTYSTEHNEPLIVKVSIPNAIKDGQIFESIKEHTPATQTWFQPPLDVEGYTLHPIDDKIYVRYQAFRPDVGYADTLSNFIMLFRDFEASYVEGYLGTELYELPRDTIEIEFFENWTRGDVYFEEPTILIGVENSFGFPVRSQTNILSILTVDGDSIGLESSFIDNGIDFAYPSLDEVGVVKETDFYFDSENSNITEIIGAGPVSVDYDLDAIPNPDQDTAVRGFLTDSSFFKVQVEVNLPIHGTAVGFEARDTFSIDLSGYENVEYVEFKLISDNGIPVEVGMQAYFVDEAGIILDSLFVPSEVIMGAAPVDSEGQVIERVEKTTFSTINKERFSAIRAAKRIYMDASFSTSNDGMDAVKIYSDQNVGFRMGMKIGIKE